MLYHYLFIKNKERENEKSFLSYAFAPVWGGEIREVKNTINTAFNMFQEHYTLKLQFSLILIKVLWIGLHYPNVREETEI